MKWVWGDGGPRGARLGARRRASQGWPVRNTGPYARARGYSEFTEGEWVGRNDFCGMFSDARKSYRFPSPDALFFLPLDYVKPSVMRTL